MIWYFQESLQLLIYAQLDKQDRDLNNWQVVIEYYININVKTDQQPSLLIKESNSYYLQNYWLLQVRIPRTRKILKQWRSITLLPLIVIVELKIKLGSSLVKLWAILRKTLICAMVPKANPPILIRTMRLLVSISLLLKKTRRLRQT